MSAELQRARNRQMIVFLLVCTAMLILLGRLYYWQVVQSPELTGYTLKLSFAAGKR